MNNVNAKRDIYLSGVGAGSCAGRSRCSLLGEDQGVGALRAVVIGE